MNLIEILPTIYGVKVPMEIKNFEVHRNRLEYFINGQPECQFLTQTSKDNFYILGTITATEISFDASEFVESTEIDVEQYDGILMAIPIFWDYELESFSCSSSDESFRSALPKEIYFENPFGETQVIRFKDNSKLSKIRDVEWQTAQQNITEKLLILKKL